MIIRPYEGAPYMMNLSPHMITRARPRVNH